jgi:SepF-like predicted cell division protein (DUF552 family)
MTSAPNFRITTIQAFIALDPEDNSEGIIGMMMPNGQWMPLIAADPDRLKDLRPLAENMAEQTHKEIKLIRLSVREDLEIIKPKKGNCIFLDVEELRKEAEKLIEEGGRKDG